LLELDPAELTDAAQEALAAEIRGRRLAQRETSVNELPRARNEIERVEDGAALPLTADEDDGLVELCVFWDGLKLSNAYSALGEHDVFFALKATNADLELRRPARFDIRVKPEDRLRAEAVLRDAMGYFPLQEVDGEVGFIPDAEPMTVGDFETVEEADHVVALLTEAGIASERKMSDEPDDDGRTWYWVEVSGFDQERALAVVAEGLGLT